MSFTFSLPQFQVETPSEQRMYAYLYQTVQQLNWVVGQLERGETEETYVSVTGKGGNAAPSGSVSPSATFQSIKGLIIKSADIVNAYYDTIAGKLQGQYVAQSDFGTYREETSQVLAANSREVEQRFQNVQMICQNMEADLDEMSDRAEGTEISLGSLQTRMQTIASDQEGFGQSLAAMENTVTSLRSNLLETNAYIRTGILYYSQDGTPVYGLEIGQTNTVDGEETFHKFARFSSSRLSFYDRNDTEVAYISDYKLYITNVHITGKLTIGEYEIDTTDGLAFRWTGGEI